MKTNAATEGKGMASEYLIRDGRAHLLYFDLDGRGGYGWTSVRGNAARYGKAEALEVARKVESAIRVNGYGNVRLSVVPARGGSAVERSA